MHTKKNYNTYIFKKLGMKCGSQYKSTNFVPQCSLSFLNGRKCSHYP